MGIWRAGPDLLARARFTLSPKAEIVTALSALLRPQDSTERAFHAAHHVAFEAALTQHPVRRVVLEYSFRPPRGQRPGWLASYLASPPEAQAVTVEDELAAVAATADSALRDDLQETMLTPLPPGLASAPLAEAATGLLGWVWTHTLETDWARRERILRADVVARTGLLATHGWAGVLRGLGRDQEWAGDGQLRINSYDLPTRVLPAAAQLCFIPVLARIGWNEQATYALYYPVTGRLASTDATRGGALARMIGANPDLSSGLMAGAGRCQAPRSDPGF